MAFHSLSFLFVFLPLAWLLQVSSRRSARLPLGLGLGLVFLAWAGLAPLAWTAACLVWVTAFSWLIRRLRRPLPRRLLTGLAVSGLIAALVAAKYLYPGLMTAGLSFLVFFAISALIDLLHRPELFSLSGLWAYLTFFPKFMTGPLLPYQRFAEQLEAADYDWDRAQRGFGRLTLGLFKKLWIADPLGRSADAVFAAGSVSGAAEHWLGLLAFALHIFIDFSAYTDMAIGLGRIFGFELGENFNFPYLARSLHDFWRRWHISLGLWFRTYLFLPLAYALERRLYRMQLPHWLRSDRLAAGLSMWLTMVVCGAWHGQSLNFWLWGLYWGSLMAFESPRRRKRGRWAWLRTQALILLGWILFRTDNPAHFVEFLRGLWPRTLSTAADTQLPLLVDGRFVWAVVAALALAFPVFPALSSRWKRNRPGWHRLLVRCEPLVWLAAWLLVLAALSGASHRPFIYQQF